MENKNRLFTLPAAVDGSAVAVMLVAALIGFWPVFGDLSFVRPGVAGLVLGAAIAWVGAWRHFRTIVVAVMVIAAYFIFGAASSLWTTAIGGAVPNAATLRTLVFGGAAVWKEFVTASTPVATFPGFTLVPFIVALIGSTAAFSAAWRSRHPAWAMAPISLSAVMVILFGTSTGWHPVAQALVIAVVAIVWLTWRRRQPVIDSGDEQVKAGVKRSRLITIAVMVAVAAVIAGLVGTFGLVGLDRDVLRRHTVSPLDIRDYPSPLASFRSLVADHSEDTLFSVEGWRSQYLLRLAVMDDYDGMVYNVGQDTTGSRYDRVGPELGGVAGPAGDGSTQVSVTVGEYSGVWVPGVSQLRAVTFTSPRAADLADELYYNVASDALIDPVSLDGGDSYTLDVDWVGKAPGEDSTIMNVRLPEPEFVPETVGALADQWMVDSDSDFERVTSLIDHIRGTGFFSHGIEDAEQSRPGHSANRIDQLVADPERMVGDDEQYAVLAALMLRELDIPARVVMGFATADQSGAASPDADQPTMSWDVTGADVHAWVEVPFSDVGWYAFFPTPDEDRQPQQELHQSYAKPKPQVLQPPPVANQSDSQDRQSSTPERDNEQKQPPFDWTGIVRVAAAVGIPVIVILGPILVIVAIKASRTRKRRHQKAPSDRVIGGWREFLDRAADRGAVAPATATRKEISAVLTKRFSVDGIEALSQEADRSAYGAETTVEAQAVRYWAELDRVTRDVDAKRPLWARLRSKLALTSLRRHARPTIGMEVMS